MFEESRAKRKNYFGSDGDLAYGRRSLWSALTSSVLG